ncbi:hypothetical protein JVT61DRAFT_1516 [Boletus reticuloceps]|uniref:Uncharacterized protein n=1 Tax=Boletus reticuloceps TaxID=495285 RepID=A0A8I2YBX7_9AGAM|nr:hypothetical protein JVT61DRAFT_1516 [Boletus reticuloceps]
MAPSNGCYSSSLSEVEDESQKPGDVNNELWDIEEEKEGNKGDEEGRENEEDNMDKGDNRDKEDLKESEQRFSDVPFEDEGKCIPNNLSGGAMTKDIADPDEHVFYGDHDDALASPQATQHGDS